MKAFFRTIVLVVSLFLFTNSNCLTKSNNLVGIWISENKDLIVQVFENKQLLYGKLVWFKCTHKEKKPMEDHKDEKNSNPDLRGKSWLNLIILSGLKYNGGNKWENGKIYDTNSGKTYSASVTLIENKIIVRGYWGIELLGKSMIFKRYE